MSATLCTSCGGRGGDGPFACSRCGGTGAEPAPERRSTDAELLTFHRDFILDAALQLALANRVDIREMDLSPVEVAAQLVYDFDDLLTATEAGHGLRAKVGGSDDGEGEDA